MINCIRCKHQTGAVNDAGLCDNCARLVAQGAVSMDGMTSVRPLIEKAAPVAPLSIIEATFADTRGTFGDASNSFAEPVIVVEGLSSGE